MTKKHKTYIVKIEEDPETGGVAIAIPENILKKLKWQMSDDIVIIASDKGAKIENLSEYFRSHWKCPIGNKNCKTNCGAYGCHN